MRRFARLTAVLAVVSLIGLLPAKAEPRGGFHLEARLPASTLAYVSLEDLSSWEARWNATAMGQLMNDPEMQAFLAPITEAGQEFISSNVGDMEPVVQELLQQAASLKGQVALALVGMDMETELPAVALSLDFGDNVAGFVEFLERMAGQMDPDGEAIRTEVRDGRTWWSVQGPDLPLFATTVDTAFVLTTDGGLLAQILAGETATSLHADPDFRTVRERLGGDDLGVFLYGNIDAALEAFGEMIPADERRIANAMGLDTITSIAYGMAFKDDGFRDTFIVHAPDADHGIVPLIDMAPMTAPKTLDLAPASTFYWAEGSLPLDDMLARVRAVAGSIDPDATEELDHGLARVRRYLGVDLEHEILAGLAGTYGLYAGLSGSGGLYPELALIFEVKDPADYEKVFARVAQGIAAIMTDEGDLVASTRTMDYHGVTMHLFEMQEARGDDVVPFTPTWAMVGNRLVITLVPHAMKEIVLRAAGTTTRGGLGSQEDFQALLAGKPARAGAMEYVDLKAVLSLLYDTGVPLLQTVAKPNVMQELPIQIDWALLPPASRVVPHFRSLAAYPTWNKDGFEVSIQSPVPMMPILFGIAAAGGMMMGGMSSDAVVYEEWTEMPVGPDAEMDVQLARIQAEMLMESAAFYFVEKERLPDSWQELVDAGMMGEIPQDPWGGAYRMSRQGGSAFAVESAGPDRAFGTPDDIRLERE